VRIGHFVPAYRQQVHVEVAMSMARDTSWAKAAGVEHCPFWVDASGIARARNLAVDTARRLDCDLLLMQDADCFGLPQVGSALGRLMRSMQSAGAAAVGAAFAVRNGASMNCEPARPGELYDGIVGTGLMLIDMRALAALPRPWFVHRDDETGTRVAVGEDVNFCRLVRAAGHRVSVDYTFPTGHASTEVVGTHADAGR
jgi:hypothetical protein